MSEMRFNFMDPVMTKVIREKLRAVPEAAVSEEPLWTVGRSGVYPNPEPDRLQERL